MKSKGVVQQVKEKEINKSCNSEITVDDIREWKKQLDDADIPNREYKFIKYCPHKNGLVTINFPFQEGDCEICFQDIVHRFLK